jgi:fermentation-respiration switch protein FrsA (DUF1100 family)
MRRVLRVLAVLVVVAALVGAGVVVARARAEAHKLLTNPVDSRHLPGRTPQNYGLPFEDVGIRTADGLSLVGWYVRGTNGAAIIAQHGYKADRGEMLNEAQMLWRRGFGVLITSLRAHDLSDGELITFGRHELGDLAAWYRWLRSRSDIDPARIGVLGNSLGGTLAIQFAAAEPGIAAVAANSAFSSLEDTIETSVRFFTGLPPFPFATLIRFFAERKAGFRASDVDATRVIATVSPRPVLLMQGGRDVVISKASGQRLFDAAREPKELWFEPKVGHVAFDGVLPNDYDRRVGGFFERYVGRNFSSADRRDGSADRGARAAGRDNSAASHNGTR